MYVRTLDMDMFTLLHTQTSVHLQPGSAGKPGAAAPSVMGHVALREVSQSHAHVLPVVCDLSACSGPPLSRPVIPSQSHIVLLCPHACPPSPLPRPL